MKKKKIKLPKIIEGYNVRYAYKENLWVNKEGTFVYREYNDKSWNTKLWIQSDADGTKYVAPHHPGRINVDKLVATCFLPKPEDEKNYQLIHKDGNLSNCHVNNLEWKEIVPSLQERINAVSDRKKLPNGLTVTCNGEVYQNGKKLDIVTSIGDSDTDSMVPVEPYIAYKKKNKYGNYEQQHLLMEKLMIQAGFVEGDKYSLNHPEVIHINGDYTDFHYDNLKWVEVNSQEYKEYAQKKSEDMERLRKELNQIP